MAVLHKMECEPPAKRDRVEAQLGVGSSNQAQRDSRGLTRGSIFKPDGTLVASVAQEGSVRERRS